MCIKRDFEKRHFNFSNIFQEYSTQQEVYDTVSKNIINAVCDGYNGSILAYGQTGTGKTYTMIGEDNGVLPRSIKQFIDKINDDKLYKFHIAAVQIYNEQLSDLLGKKELKLRELPNNTFMIQNLRWIEVTSYSTATQIVE